MMKYFDETIKTKSYRTVQKILEHTTAIVVLTKGRNFLKVLFRFKWISAWSEKQQSEFEVGKDLDVQPDRLGTTRTYPNV